MAPLRIPPGPGQESVWDYPRPPALDEEHGPIVVFWQERRLVDAPGGLRILETSHPPTIYVDPAHVNMELLEPMSGSSHCEWKGQARYYRLRDGDERVERVAWTYPEPDEKYRRLAGWLCFDPGKLPCFLGGERVKPQEGGFYGGWVTSRVVGPFKGGPGTAGW